MSYLLIVMSPLILHKTETIMLHMMTSSMWNLCRVGGGNISEECFEGSYCFA